MSGWSLSRFSHFLELFLPHRLALQRGQLRYPVDVRARGSSYWVRIGLACVAREMERDGEKHRVYLISKYPAHISLSLSNKNLN